MKPYTAKLLPVILLVGLTVFAADVSADTSSLISSLMNTLNVSEDQARWKPAADSWSILEAGAVFSAAKNNMTPQDFSTVSKALPGIDSLIAAAPAIGSSGGSSLGGVSSMLGKVAGSTDTMAGLVQAFSQLGLGSDMVGKYTDIILQFADSQAGQSVVNLLKNALL